MSAFNFFLVHWFLYMANLIGMNSMALTYVKNFSKWHANIFL